MFIESIKYFARLITNQKKIKCFMGRNDKLLSLCDCILLASICCVNKNINKKILKMLDVFL